MAPRNLLPILLSLVLLIQCAVAGGFTSDGNSAGDGEPYNFRRRLESAKSCEQTYGFLPCTSTVLGNLFLCGAYGYLMYLAATYLSAGSELLLEILGPGIVGGLFLPVLGALPDAMLILVSGLSGSKETAQKQVSVGIGLLAGSTVMLLTVIWGSCVVVGKCDLQNNVSIDSQDTKCFSPTGSGVTTDIWTSYAARIMAVSVIPFVVVQLLQILHSNSGRHLAVLVALIVSLLLLVAYCSYQVFQPWIQRRRLAYARHKHVVSGILKHFKMRGLGKLSDRDGNPNREVLQNLFRTIDENDDGFLSHSELTALIAGIQLELVNLDYNEAVSKVLKDFDSSRDNRVDFDEFVAGVGKWLHEARGRGVPADSMAYIDEHHKNTRRHHDLLLGGEAQNDDDEAAPKIENRRRVTIKATMLLVLGTAIAAAFADPLVDAVDNFSSATKIPTFFISFVALPLATNSSEAVSAIIFASRKKMRSASLTFSELYGAVTMNNVLCLSVFLALVYVRGLNWNFSSEVLVILIVCIVMGAFASFRTTFPLWSCSIAFFLYPFSLGLVYLLDYHFGWS